MSDPDTRLARAIEDHQQGRLEKAAAAYADILRMDPDHADALHLSGLISFQQGDLDRAQHLIGRAVSRDRKNPLYLSNLGRVEMARGAYKNAVENWKLALEITPGSADLHSDIAGAYLELGAANDAVRYADMALTLDADHVAAGLNRGLALAALGENAKAIECLERSARQTPNNPTVWFTLGSLYQSASQSEQAERAYLKTIEYSDAPVDALNNLANLYREQGKFEQAVDAYVKALGFDNSQSDIHSNLGVALQEMGRTVEAISSYRKAVALNSENAEARRNLGMGLLLAGQFEEGWSEYEWRWKTRHFQPVVRAWDKPRWRGDARPDQTLLVHCEQGFGDCIQFVRYLAVVAPMFEKVILEAPVELVDLFASVEGVSHVTPFGKDLPSHDLQIPLLSLPYVLGTTLTTLPNAAPYLAPGPDTSTRWTARLKKRAGDVLVGVAWQGSDKHARDKMRSPGLQGMAGLFEVKGRTRFISLQKEGLSDNRLEDYRADLQTFEDTAALMCQLDAVVTPDTVIAHLAGALNIPTYVVLPRVAEWRWLEDRSDSPWYPSMELFRQSKASDWGDCIERLSKKLAIILDK